MDNAPYISQYLKCVDESYDFIYWDRREVKEENEAGNNYYTYNKKINNKIDLLFGYLGFRRFSISLLKKNKYERLIVLSSNTGSILEPYLSRNYNGRYIFDIRDYWKENNRLYYMIEKEIINRAALTFISSPFYKKFLPRHNYFITHNIPNYEEHKVEKVREINQNRKPKLKK